MRISLVSVLSLALMAGAARADECHIVVQFPFNSATIPSEFLPSLDKVAQALKSGNVEIVGNTDLVGSVGYNLELSKRRAKAVEDRLIAAGMSPSKIVKVEGVGKSNPVVNTPGPNQENRRVEVNIGDCRTEVFAGSGLSTGEQIALGVAGAALIIAILSGGNGKNSPTTTTTTTTTGGGG